MATALAPGFRADFDADAAKTIVIGIVVIVGVIWITHFVEDEIKKNNPFAPGNSLGGPIPGQSWLNYLFGIGSEDGSNSDMGGTNFGATNPNSWEN